MAKTSHKKTTVGKAVDKAKQAMSSAAKPEERPATTLAVSEKKEVAITSPAPAPAKAELKKEEPKPAPKKEAKKKKAPAMSEEEAKKLYMEANAMKDDDPEKAKEILQRIINSVDPDSKRYHKAKELLEKL